MGPHPSTEKPPAQLGQYRLVRKLARGGMAEIFLAVQQGPQGFEKVVVLKWMLPELCASEEFVRMFLDEARLAARLEHPNIVRVYGMGEVAGRYYLTMEYLPGEDLASVVHQAYQEFEAIPPDLAIELVLGAAQGLHFAHELADAEGNPLNVVHRDVSPSNVFVTYRGEVKVVDFGLARMRGKAVDTGTGALKGTFLYMAPEQVEGTAVDRRTDVFQLGLVLHELLTGQRLFLRANEAEILQAVRHAEITPPSRWRVGLPPELDAIAMSCLARNPAERFQSAAELVAALTPLRKERDSLAASERVASYLASLFGEDVRRKKLGISAGGLGAKPEETSLALEPDDSLEPTLIRADSTGRIEPRGERRIRPAVLLWALGGAAAMAAVAVAASALTHHGAAPPPPAPPPAVVAEAPPKPAPVQPPPEPPKMAVLRFETLPPGAQVKVDGVAVADTASGFQVAAGAHLVVVEAKGYLPFESIAEVAAGEARAVAVSAKRRREEPRGTVEVACVPWCRIAVDGKDTGKTSPARLTLAPGTYVLSLENPPAGLAKRVQVKVAAGATVREVIRLED